MKAKRGEEKKRRYGQHSFLKHKIQKYWAETLTWSVKDREEETSVPKGGETSVETEPKTKSNTETPFFFKGLILKMKNPLKQDHQLTDTVKGRIGEPGGRSGRVTAPGKGKQGKEGNALRGR